MKGGNLIFRVEFRDRKGQKWELLETNQHKFLQKFPLGSKQYSFFGYVLFMSCFKCSEECSYSDFYIEDHDFKIWLGKIAP